jgi:hypothetical protein
MYQAGGSIASARPGRPATGSPYLQSFVVEGGCKVDVPPGRYHVVAEHGLEYERAERSIEAPGNLRIRLKPWIRMRAKGWYSADTHIHRPLEEIPALVQAEDLNFSVALTMWNRTNFFAGKTSPSDPILKVTPTNLVSIMNAEDERAGGAWMIHMLDEPLGLEPLVPAGQNATQSWFPPGAWIVRKARAQRKPGELMPWFEIEKPIWWEAPVMMALEAPDSIGLLHNHFNQYGMRDDEAWGRKRDIASFPDYVLTLVYRYWNLGFKIPITAGSASGVLPNPVGYNRVYVKMDAPPSFDKWYKAIRDGESFVTNGPMLFLNASVKNGKLTGTVEAIAREPIDRIEIVANGKVVQTITSSKARLSLDASRYSWIAARCFLKTPYTVRLAHTRPIWTGVRRDASEDARYFVRWIDDLMTVSDARNHDIYREARKVYEGKIK